ncbi:MAG: iron permease, partial [Dokdonella sp.]
MTTIRIRFARHFVLTLCALLFCAVASIASAQNVDSTVPQTWQMLDYLATDYAGAVQDGAITSASEYAEMQEFAATIRKQLQALSPTPSSASLLSEADTLVASIEAKAALEIVASQAHGLADDLLQAYPVPTAPEHTPDLTRGSQIYQG